VIPRFCANGSFSLITVGEPFVDFGGFLFAVMPWGILSLMSTPLASHELQSFPAKPFPAIVPQRFNAML
jgi:hypothetical protein